MASLTDNLPGVNSAARIIDPQNDKGPTFLQGLANIAEMAVTGGSRLYEKNAAESARVAANKARADTASAENASAKLIVDHAFDQGVFAPPRLNPEPQQTPEPGYVPIDASLEGPPLPPGVERTVGEVSRARAAENQGRAPSGSSQIMLESAVNQLIAQHPDNVDAIVSYFKTQGFDHFVFRDRDLQRKAEDAEIDTVLKGQQDYYNAAVQAGTIAPGTPLAEGAEAGRQQAKAVEDMRLAKELRDSEAAATAAERGTIEWKQKEQDRDAVSRGLAFASAGLGPLMTQLNALSLESLQDPNNTKTFEQAVPEFAVSIDNIINQTRMTMAQNHERPEAIEAATAELNNYKKNLIDFTSGPLSQFAQSKRTLESLQNRLGMNIQQAMPIYSGLKEVLGQGGLNALFPTGSIGPLPPEIMQQLSGEIAGISGAVNTDPERLSMRNIAELLRGQTSIDRMSEDQARRIMPSLVAVSGGAAQDYLQRGASPDQFFNSTLQVANAAAGLQPGVTSEGAKSVVVAATALFNPTATSAILKFRTENPEQGQQLVDSTRSSAVRVHKILRDRQLTPVESMGGIWSVQYRYGSQNGAGTYVMTLPREAYNRWAATQQRGSGYSGTAGGAERGMGRPGVPSYEQLLRDPPAAVKQQAASLNMSLNFLVQTSQYDEDFKGVSPNEVRAFFGRDLVPQAMRARTEAENNSPSFNERLQALRTGFTEVSTNAVSQQVATTQEVRAGERPRAAVDYFVGKGYPSHVSAGIVGNLMAESGPTMQTSAVGDGGKAMSLAQWHPDRRREAQAQGYDLTDFNSALGFVDWELNNTESEAGRRLKAARTATEAADIFAQYFLRPAGAQTGDANQIHNIAGRRRNAQSLIGN